MTNVQSRESRAHFHANTGCSSRKNPRPITCSGCDGTSGDCVCLRDWRIHRQIVPHLRRLLDSGKGLDKAVPIIWLAARKQSREALARLVAQDEQREREQAAYKAFGRAMRDEKGRKYSAAKDREILDQLIGMDRHRARARSLEEVAEGWKRPVAYVRDLRDRCLIALRSWPKSQPSTAAVARRAA